MATGSQLVVVLAARRKTGPYPADAVVTITADVLSTGKSTGFPGLIAGPSLLTVWPSGRSMGLTVTGVVTPVD